MVSEFFQKFLYKKAGTCPNDECESRLYKVENKMKKLKDSMSHQVWDCKKKLNSAVQHNNALSKINSETADHASNKCAASRSKSEALNSKSSSLRSELAQQKQKLKSFRRQALADSAQSNSQIKSLNQNLKNTKSDLVDVRKSVLSRINSVKKMNYTVGTAKQKSEESFFWKNLYTRTLVDLEEAEEKIEDLEDDLDDEKEELREIRIKQSNAKISLAKERKSKIYYKNVSKRNEELLQSMERKYLKARAQKHVLNEEYGDLRDFNNDLKTDLKSCKNATTVTEKRAKNAVNLKRIIESKLISKVSSKRQQISLLKERLGTQVKVISELEHQRTVSEQTLVKKIGTNKGKFLSAKSALENALDSVDSVKQDSSTKMDVMRSKVLKLTSEKSTAVWELERSKTTIAEFQHQISVFQNHTRQLEDQITKLFEEASLRDIMQQRNDLALDETHRAEISELHLQYHTILNATHEDLFGKLSAARAMLNKSVEEYNNKNTDLILLERRNEKSVANLEERFNKTSEDLGIRHSQAMNALEKRYNKTLKILEKEKKSAKHWKNTAQIKKHHNNRRLTSELKSCKSGKVTSVAEYKKNNELLMEILSEVASRNKVCTSFFSNH